MNKTMMSKAMTLNQTTNLMAISAHLFSFNHRRVGMGKRRQNRCHMHVAPY